MDHRGSGRTPRHCSSPGAMYTCSRTSSRVKPVETTRPPHGRLRATQGSLCACREAGDCLRSRWLSRKVLQRGATGHERQRGAAGGGARCKPVAVTGVACKNPPRPPRTIFCNASRFRGRILGQLAVRCAGTIETASRGSSVDLAEIAFPLRLDELARASANLRLLRATRVGGVFGDLEQLIEANQKLLQQDVVTAAVQVSAT